MITNPGEHAPFDYVEAQVYLGDASTALAVAANHYDQGERHQLAAGMRSARDGLKIVMAMLDAVQSGRTTTEEND